MVETVVTVERTTTSQTTAPGGGGGISALKINIGYFQTVPGILKLVQFAVLLEKLKYAKHFCKSIDADEYACVAMGDSTEATGSEDDSDLESAASNEA